jgi:hypothetical protein
MASEASHFRFGIITWKPRPDISATAAEFTVQQAWRRTSCGGSAGDGYVAVGDPACVQTDLSYGDGAFDPIGGTVVSIDPVNDWYLQSYTSVHEYPTANNGGAPWEARYDSCCRIYENVNAPGTSFTQIATVDLGISNSSPVTTLLPIIAMEVDAANSVALPLGDLDGDALACRLATPAESGIAAQPSATNALSVSASCVLNWDTAGTSIGQLWATAIVVEESQGGDPSHGRIPLEFLILIVGDTGTDPVCDVPPTPTGTVSIPAGQPYVATIQGSDVDAGQTLSLNSSGVPSWCSLAPALPTSSASPISSVLTCNPTVADAGPGAEPGSRLRQRGRRPRGAVASESPAPGDLGGRGHRSGRRSGDDHGDVGEPGRSRAGEGDRLGHDLARRLVEPAGRPSGAQRQPQDSG